MDYAALILAGGDARRLGGADKPRMPVAGVPMLVHVLRATGTATARIVVGPPELRDLAPMVVREDPPGGGPVAAVAAAFDQVRVDAKFTAILAGDLPLLSAAALDRLLVAVSSNGRSAGATETTAKAAASGGSREHDGAVFIDADGREQWLCGVWRTESLRVKLAAIDPAGAPLRRLFQGLDFVTVSDASPMPPWYDCDTANDVKRAEEWLTR